MSADNVVNPVPPVFIGAAHLDESVTLLDALQPGESNRVSRTCAAGGVATNAARAAQAHIPCHLIAALGCDLAGEILKQQLQQSGIHCQFVSGTQQSTGQYTAVLDAEGELVLGLANSEITECLSAAEIKKRLENIPEAPLIAFDSNLSSACLSALCDASLAPTLVALGVSPVKNMRLLDQACQISLLFINRREACMLTGRRDSEQLPMLSQALSEIGFEQHVITDGADPVLVRDTDRNTMLPTEQTLSRSVNGAGDALAGATIAGLACGLGITESVQQLGLPAAAALINNRVPALHPNLPTA